MAFPGQMSGLPTTERILEVPNAAGSPGRTWQLFWSLSIPASLIGWRSRTYPTRAAHRVFYARSFKRPFLLHVVPVVWKNSLESRRKGPIREYRSLHLSTRYDPRPGPWTQIQRDGTAAGMAAYPTKIVATGDAVATRLGRGLMSVWDYQRDVAPCFGALAEPCWCRTSCYERIYLAPSLDSFYC